MPRPQEFDRDQVLDAAIGVFRQHGFEGSSASMLVEAMGIGRQSLYNSFGDKWQLYRAAIEHYAAGEIAAHLAALKTGPRAIDGIACFLDRVAASAQDMCLGVSSICEFGTTRPDLSAIHDRCGKILNAALIERVRQAREEGDLLPDTDADDTVAFLVSTLAGLRVSARAGADRKTRAAIARAAMRGIR
ncbi:TetR/AcrR family transcriptional regulator [Gluconacetobacter takamatsuzukensis]|uniref:TetR/AcrR family transcriptional regulator n=1 Tax=Gluconacetobacter takamatsuzukensis TaxID=1286190 RepID=A0A7W4KFT6_9PROT|nr:TetR/AcrR family transcriptional regulator [Gluconacetobacter takamatsuzukensis]MBB2206025.1 TetR/AcrR family transcriptional regulator [Gluconacetobacter takamatsuzukensis]